MSQSNLHSLWLASQKCILHILLVFKNVISCLKNNLIAYFDVFTLFYTRIAYKFYKCIKFQTLYYFNASSVHSKYFNY